MNQEVTVLFPGKCCFCHFCCSRFSSQGVTASRVRVALVLSQRGVGVWGTACCTNAFQGPTTFHLNQISSFANSTWAQNQGSGWLGDVQIHGWDSESGSAIFLKPWSKGNLSDEEVTELEELFRVYLIGFIRVVQDHVSEFQLTYPFEIQGTAGCELREGKATVSFLRGALGGVDFVSISNGTCVPAAEGGSRAQWFCTLSSQYQGISDIIQKLLYHTCPRFLWSVLEAGKAELQRQGFYPKPVWVMWMRGQQELPGTQQGDFLPNADGTWYLRVTLDVAAGRQLA
ncbi:hypothetical protein QTO34_011639 [Cnephaeus nilssonii]|uniref:MHC class I-like antigen recognition-like domain-containing protein n=1 Tax=Cnephaeus nilssonii TaxID=3371016 RepID=A0AA40HDV7_CNENI|nr:hypothetical protein QTO34_011639 [Eptesicus nilssonii]